MEGPFSGSSDAFSKRRLRAAVSPLTRFDFRDVRRHDDVNARQRVERRWVPTEVAATAEHFHPLGKQPSAETVAVVEAARKSLPFADLRDVEEARKGFIAARSTGRSWTRVGKWH